MKQYTCFDVSEPEGCEFAYAQRCPAGIESIQRVMYRSGRWQNAKTRRSLNGRQKLSTSWNATTRYWRNMFSVGCLAWNLCCLYLTMVCTAWLLENSVQALPDLHKDFFDTIQKFRNRHWFKEGHLAEYGAHCMFMILRGPSIVRW